MEVIAQSLTVGFSFDSPTTSPHPLGTTFFYSAPSSPVRDSDFCRQDFHGGANCSPSSVVPFYWEEKPGIPKQEYISRIKGDDLKGTDFEFGSGGNFERCSLSADELFDGGKIRQLKPPPGFHYNQNKPFDSSKSPCSPTNLIVQTFSLRQRMKDFDPFAEALEQMRKSDIQESGNGDKRGGEKTISNSSNSPSSSRHRGKKDFVPFAAALEQTRKSNNQESGNGDKRGREKTISYSSNNPSSSRHKGTRSLSPFRVADLLSNQEDSPEDSPMVSLSSASSVSSLWHKKWKIKGLFLFRSASESWATDNDQMKKKNSFLKKTHYQDEVTESSFSSTASCESESSRRRSVPPISAHKFHYSVKRTVFEEMRKRRSLLPYRQGILGCLGFQRTVPEIHRSL